MTTGQRILYDAAEQWTREWAEEIRKNRNGHPDSLLVYSRARAASIMEMLEAIAHPGHGEGKKEG